MFLYQNLIDFLFIAQLIFLSSSQYSCGNYPIHPSPRSHKLSSINSTSFLFPSLPSSPKLFHIEKQVHNLGHLPYLSLLDLQLTRINVSKRLSSSSFSRIPLLNIIILCFSSLVITYLSLSYPMFLFSKLIQVARPSHPKLFSTTNAK